MAPVIKQAKLDPNITLIHLDSNQHYDRIMNRQFFDDLNLPYPDYTITINRSNKLLQLSSMIEQITKFVNEVKPDIILAQGDTDTVMVTAIIASKTDCPFGHIEAGIRSFDLSMPEELNRRIADLSAAIHFCPSNLSGINLLFEGIDPSRIYITGNTIVDAVESVKNIIIKNKTKFHSFLNSNFLRKILVTLHRPSNVDVLVNLEEIFKAFKLLPKYQFIFPIHPRTLKNLKKFNLYDKIANIDNITIIEPLGYIDFLSLLLSVDLIISDSGGVQEECLCLGKKCLTLRGNTERPETIFVGSNKLVNINASEIINSIEEIFNSSSNIILTNIIGKGDSAKKIVTILKSIDNESLSFKSPKMTSWIDYQFKLDEIEKTIIVKDYELLKKRKIVIIFDNNGKPCIPEPEFTLISGNKIITIGSNFD